MHELTAPYNFVPVSDRICLVSENEVARISHDVPFSDGLCGSVDLEIRAETQLFTSDSDSPHHFFTLPDGHLAIPGTSIKGMVRSVVEIASFGKLVRVNDRVVAVRDLNGPSEQYRDYMSGIINRKTATVVSAGWLSWDRSGSGETYSEAEGGDGSPVWYLQPCNFAKISYEFLGEIMKDFGIRSFDPGWAQKAPERYKAWGKQRDIQAEVDVIARHGSVSTRGVGRLGDYGEVTRVGKGEAGTLVLTGQPSRFTWPPRGHGDSTKYHDFFFYGSVGDRIRVPFAVRRSFSLVHSGSGEQHRLDVDPNHEWKFWKNESKIPVFFVLEKGEPAEKQIRAMGLAMMFRLSANLTTGQAVANAQKNSPDLDGGKLSDVVDLAESIFGFVPDPKTDSSPSGAGGALRGRVVFETAVLKGKPQFGETLVTVLGGPKPSYYPAYLKQPEADSQGALRDRSNYVTYMDTDAEARGWKRYPQVASRPSISTPDDTNSKMITTMTPLLEGTVFSTKMHFHNIRPYELGAVLWALDFGGRADRCRHGLGKGKPLGLGGVSITLSGFCIESNKKGKSAPDEKGIRQAYIDYMENWMRTTATPVRERGDSWQNSEQIIELLAMATPVQDIRFLRQMILGRRGNNQFENAKKAARSLPRFSDALAGPRRLNRDVATDTVPKPQTCLDELIEARASGQHIALIEHWQEEGGKLEAKRIAAVRQFMERDPRLAKKLKRFAEWLGS